MTRCDTSPDEFIFYVISKHQIPNRVRLWLD